MLFLRIAFVLALLAVGGAGILYLTSRDKRYLSFIYRVLRYTLYLLAAVAVYYILDRLFLV